MSITEEARGELAQRVAFSAFAYYPEIHADEIAFDLQQEISWCLEPAAGQFADEDTHLLRDLVARTIIDPTAYREVLNDTLDSLIDDPAADPDGHGE